MRSLAAIVWASTDEPPHIGIRLAKDDDVRVRRALAEAVTDALTPTTRATDIGARGALAQVRDLAGRPELSRPERSKRRDPTRLTAIPGSHASVNPANTERVGTEAVAVASARRP